MIRLLSLFSGIGAFETALRRGGYQFETVNYCEIDPYASKAYSQIHDIPEGKNLHDVREINPLLLDNINLVTYEFPCQDISVAGKQKGFEYDGERTRSGLFFEALRIIEFLQPEYAIAENVKALTSKKFTAEFQTVLSGLSEAGYNNYWEVLNAKDYGIPQNRERVFIISIRKDIDTGNFTFPEKQELKLRVKDMLEPVVDEKYYIDNERSRNLIRQITAKFDLGGGIAVSDGTIKDPKVKDVSNTIKARYDCGIENQKSVGCMVLEPVICASRGRNPENPSDRTLGIKTEQRLEVNKDGMSNTLTTVQKDNYVIEPKIIDDTLGFEKKDRTSKNMSWQKYKSDQSYYIKQIRDNNIATPVAIDEQNRVVRADGTVGTLTTDGSSPKHNNRICDVDYRIRKLTPRECFRLMGFTDNDFDKIHGISNTQLYKMAGNSIVVNVLEAIFKQLFKETNKE